MPGSGMLVSMVGSIEGRIVGIVIGVVVGSVVGLVVGAVVGIVVVDSVEGCVSSVLSLLQPAKDTPNSNTNAKIQIFFILISFLFVFSDIVPVFFKFKQVNTDGFQ